MSAKQAGMLSHYENTYAATLRYELQRNRLFVVLILVLMGSTYLALDKKFAEVALGFLIPSASPEFLKAVADVNFLRVFSIASTLAVFYLIVNLHHRVATIKRNYKYLGALEEEIRQELALAPSAVFFTRESVFYQRNLAALGFFRFARISYGVVITSFICLFLVARISFDRPNSWSTDWLWQWNNTAPANRQIAYDQLLFIFDIILTGPILLALLAYLILAFRQG